MDSPRTSRSMAGWLAPRWVLAAAAMLALPASWYWWSVERATAERLARAQRGQAALAPVHGRVSERIRDWEKLRANAAAAEKILTRLGDAPQLWQRRTVTVENQRMSRAEAEQYLQGLSAGEDSLLVPSAILLKAGKPGGSVFGAHRGQDAPDALLATIKADIYTRRPEPAR